MTIILIILGVWFAVSVVLVLALMAAASRSGCFDPEAVPVQEIVPTIPIGSPESLGAAPNSPIHFKPRRELPST